MTAGGKGRSYTVVIEDRETTDGGVRGVAKGEQTEVASGRPRLQVGELRESGHGGEAGREGKEGGEDLGHVDDDMYEGDDDDV